MLTFHTMKKLEGISRHKNEASRLLPSIGRGQDAAVALSYTNKARRRGAMRQQMVEGAELCWPGDYATTDTHTHTQNDVVLGKGKT